MAGNSDNSWLHEHNNHHSSALDAESLFGQTVDRGVNSNVPRASPAASGRGRTGGAREVQAAARNHAGRGGTTHHNFY